jgi:hypothetical protein
MFGDTFIGKGFSLKINLEDNGIFTRENERKIYTYLLSKALTKLKAY